MTAFKVLAHDFSPPIQGGAPVWDGVTLPFEMPEVTLDTSMEECAAGWNYTQTLAQALKVTGFWKAGRPSVCLNVAPSSDGITRGDKSRCSRLTILSRCTREEVLAALREMSEPFGEHADRMAESQFAWMHALARPNREKAVVEACLQTALDARGLDCEIREYESARAAWDAWAPRDARAAWAAWAARDAWDARDARAAQAAAWAAWAAWAARAARDAWDAWAARDALTVEYAALEKWIDHDPLLLTTGIRDAYESGLESALPTGPKVLGYAMKEGA